eukprot:258215_1
MAESDELESWLEKYQLSELLPILLENDVSELTDFTEDLGDESEIDQYIEFLSLNISSTLQNQLRNALLTLCNLNGTDSFQSEEIEKMDKALSKYYASLGRNDYQNKLAEFIKANEIDEKNIEQQLCDNAQVSNCLLVDMDQDFPLIIKTKNIQQRNKEVFKVLQYCYKYGIAPNNNQTETETKISCSDDSD